MPPQNSSPKGTKRFSDQDLCVAVPSSQIRTWTSDLQFNAVVKKSDEEQTEFRTFVDYHGKFSEKQKSALQIDSVEKFGRFWNSTLSAKAAFEASQKHGVGLAVQRAQEFATSAHDILKHFEPIVQLVMDFGAPYGGMAIGTIVFLFTIAMDHTRIEQQISDTLVQIGDRVPGLDVYRHIYNDNHELDRRLQSNIVQAYESFVSFCIAATKYYSKGTMRRWFNCVWGSTTLQYRASEVQKAIVDVRHTSEELLNKNVDAIKKLASDQARKIESLEARIKQLQDGHDSDRLDKIQALLDIKTYSAESQLDLFRTYKRNIDADFDRNWAYLEWMDRPRLDAFQSDPKFQAWRNSTNSTMLILAGYNNDYFAGECWLSPVALHIIESMGESGQADPYTFYILGHRQLEVDLLPQVLSCIVLQLLKLNLQGLQNEYQYNELCAEIEKYRSKAKFGGENRKEQEYSDSANALLQEVALRVLNMFDSSKPVWIIIDRVDKCKSRSINHRKKLLQSLVYLVEKARVKVRVLAVVNGYDWRVDEEVDELKQSISSSVIIHTGRQGSVY